MTEAASPPRRRRWWKLLLYAGALGIVMVAGLAWYTTTDSFRNLVEGRLVNELERITGGRVEVDTIHFTPFRLRVDIRGLTIRGKEKESDVPLAHIDRLVADIKITSILKTEIGFHSLVLDRPSVHVIFYPDGTTNLPAPLQSSGGGNPLERLFALSINRLDVRHGEALWGDETIPLDFLARDVSLQMTYSYLRRQYETSLLIGKADTQWKDCRPISWMAESHLTVAHNEIVIRSLKATSGRSRIEGSGRIKDLEHPQVEATFTSSFDLGEVAAVLRRTDVRNGTFVATGKGNWSSKDFAASGKLSLKDFDGHNQSVALHNVSLETTYNLNAHQIRLSQIQGRIFGGSASGSAEVSNWLRAGPEVLPRNGTRASKNTMQKGSVQLGLRDISISEMASALSTPTQPWKKLNLVGTGNGSLNARWTGSFQNTDAEIAFDVNSPNQPKSTQLPVNAHLRAAYHVASESLEIAEFKVATRSTQIAAIGSLSSSAALRVSLATTDLNEWQPVLAIFGDSQQVPVIVHGHASFQGTATGKLSNLSVTANLQVQDFDSMIPVIARTPEQQVHWDSLTALLQISQSNIAARNGVLRRGDSTINFDLSTMLQKGKLTRQSPFTASVDMRNAEIAEFLPLLGLHYPVSGKVNLRVHASGTQQQPHGEGHVEIANAVAYGETVPYANADLRFTQGEAQVNNLQLAYDSGTVTGAASYNPTTRAFRLNLAGSNFDLIRIPQIQRSPLKVEGHLDFRVSGSGTPAAPQINASVRLHELDLDKEPVGDFTLDAVSKGIDLHLTGRSQFQKAELAVDGDIRLTGDWPSTLAVKFNQLDVDPLLRLYLKGGLTGHSSMAGSLQMNGPLRKLKDADLTADLNEFHIDVENLKLNNSGPLRFSVSRQVLNLDQVHLVGERTDLTASGTINLAGDRELNLRANGRMNLRLIESFNHDFTSSGVVTMNMTVSGTAIRPAAEGRVQITNGAIAYIDLPSALSEINGSLLFNQDRLQIENLTAKTGGGQVTFTGYATTYNRQLRFDLGVQGQDVRLRYPPGVSATASMGLRFVGSSDSSTLSGDITVSKLSMTPGFDFATYLARNAQSATLPQTNPLLNRIRLDVHVVTTPELRMQTASLRLSGNADLRLRGTAAKPALLGRAEITEGEVYFNGTKYRLERGEISFLNPAAIKPRMDLQATTHVRDYEITLTVSGEPDRPVVNYRSEPPLPPADIVALLALGRTREESAQMQQSGQSPFGTEASNAILTEALNATVSSRVQRLFGGSRVKIDPEGLATETTTVARGPAVTIEQQVAGNLTLTYTTNLSQSSQQIIQVEYNVSRNVSIVGLRDQNGVVSIDVRIRRRKK